MAWPTRARSTSSPSLRPPADAAQDDRTGTSPVRALDYGVAVGPALTFDAKSCRRAANLAWLRPFGISGAVSFEQPLAGGTSTNIGCCSMSGWT